MLISQLVDLCLEFVRLLLLDHFDVTGRDLLDLSEATVGETIASEADIDKSGVLVQGFKHDCLDLFTKEVVSQFDLTDFLVSLQSIDQENETGVIQAARAEVETLEFGATLTFAHDNLSEELQDLVAQEVLVADKSLKVGLW